MTPTEPLTLRWVLTAHVRLVRQYGGQMGVRDVGLVDSALHRPLAGFEGERLFKSPVERAGVLWLGLIRNHGFVDGNKRTGTAAMARWLHLEGLRLRSGQDDLVAMAVAIAAGEVDLEAVATWLGAHTAPA